VTPQVRHAAAAVAVLAGAGVLGGLLWDWVTEPATYLVGSGGAYLDEHGLGQVFSADGWFLVVGLALGALAGGALTFAFRRDGWTIVVAVLVGAGVASAACYLVGHALGPGDLEPRLAAAGAGEQVPVPLTVRASGVYFGWPIGAMLGALVAALAWDRGDPAAVVPVMSQNPTESDDVVS
jgi:hypothetical protein